MLRAAQPQCCVLHGCTVPQQAEQSESLLVLKPLDLQARNDYLLHILMEHHEYIGAVQVFRPDASPSPLLVCPMPRPIPPSFPFRVLTR